MGHWLNNPRPPNVLREALTLEGTDELAAGFHCNLGEGFGPLSLQHVLRPTVEKILTAIIQTVDTMQITEHQGNARQTKRWLDTGVPNAFRTEVIVKTAELAAHLFLAALEEHTERAVKSSFEDACEMAVLAMQKEIGRRVESVSGVLRVEIDAQRIIREKAELAATSERKRKERLYAAIPGVRVRAAKGRPPLGWTKTELAREVKKALRSLPTDERDVEGVYKRLSARHPDRMPKSAQALKQLIYDKGLTLKGLKNEAAKGRKIRAR